MTTRYTFYVFVILFSTLVVLQGCNKNKDNSERNATTKPIEYPQGLTYTPEKPNTTTASINANPLAGMARYETKTAKDAIAFDVRGDKLEAIINEQKLGISFGTPRDYRTTSYKALPANDIVRQNTEISTGEFTVTPLHAFTNDKNYLVISQITTSKINSFQEFIDKYELINKSKFAPATLLTSSFKNKDIPMAQFFVQESQNGLFRVFFPSKEANKFIQFDYTIRRVSFKEDIEKIEPSLGSITRIVTNTP